MSPNFDPKRPWNGPKVSWLTKNGILTLLDIWRTTWTNLKAQSGGNQSRLARRSHKKNPFENPSTGSGDNAQKLPLKNAKKPANFQFFKKFAKANFVLEGWQLPSIFFPCSYGSKTTFKSKMQALTAELWVHKLDPFCWFLSFFYPFFTVFQKIC